MPDHLGEMISALAAEAAAAQEPRNRQVVQLEGGVRGEQTEAGWLYRFPVPRQVSIDDDTPVIVSEGKQRVAGSVVSFKGGVLTVALAEDLGPRVASCRLETHAAFLLERLADRMREVQGGGTEFRTAAADRALGLAPARAGSGALDPRVVDDGTLNAGQVAVVERALGSDCLFVWGPPGTGKTTVVARIVEAHYRAGRSVLLVSNTNAAVDNALLRLAERLKGDPAFHRGSCLRHGAATSDELRTRFGHAVILDEVVAHLGADLATERVSLTAELEDLGARNARLREARAVLERAAETRQALAAQGAHLASLAGEIQRLDDEFAAHAARTRELEDALERARSAGWGARAMRRLFGGSDPDTLERDLHLAKRAYAMAAAAVRALRDERARVEADTSSLRSEARELEAACAGLDPLDAVRQELRASDERGQELQARKFEVEAALAKLARDVREGCRVLATTAYQTYLRRDPFRSFDVVVIDEASMMLAPLTWFVAGLARGSVVVAGDFRQLPPIVRTDEAAAKRWLCASAFEVAGLPAALARRETPPALAALDVQYRMVEPICELVNDLFYPDHRLVTAPGTGRGAPPLPLALAPVTVVDTGVLAPWAARPAGSRSRYNLQHAVLVRALGAKLLGGANALAAEALGIIAPYREQARLHQSILDERFGERTRGVAATVHRFQGKERSVIVLDLVDAAGSSLGSFLRARTPDDAGWKLLNVAISRAQHRLVVVGDLAFLRANAPPGGILERVLDALARHGTTLDATEILAHSEAPWVDATDAPLPESWILEATAAGVFDEHNFYLAFHQDLERARRTVVIACPFVTKSGARRWLDALRTALARGVHVTVVTRPPGEHEGDARAVAHAVLTDLATLGVQIRLRAQMHEKIAVIDREVVWNGSLNILSQRDSRETMTRTPSRALARTMWKRLSEEGPVEAPAERSLPCPEPGCRGWLVKRSTGARPFLGCSRFPVCKFARDL